MKLKLIPILVIFISVLFYSDQAQSAMVISFFEKIKKSCPEVPPNFAKKMLVHFLMTHKSGEPFCTEKEEQLFKKLCGTRPTCAQANVIFIEIQKENSGNIIGH